MKIKKMISYLMSDTGYNDLERNAKHGRGKEILNPSEHLITTIAQQNDLNNIWRSFHPDKAGYTHFHKEIKKSNRIEYCLCLQIY